MSRYLQVVDQFANDYHLSSRDRLKLKLRAPIVKVHWYADHGSRPLRALSEALSPMLNHEISIRVEKFSKTTDIDVSFQQSDFASYREVLMGACYALPVDLSSIRTIVDLGANIGMAGLYFSLNCPNLERLVMVEANPRLMQTIEHNMREQMARTSVKILNACIGIDPAPESTFHVAKDHRMSHKDGEAQDGELVAVSVKNLRLSSMLDEMGMKEVDLLKIDIEGAEFDVLEDHDVLRRFRYIIGEIHGEAAKRKVFADRIRQLGFELPKDHVHEENATYELMWAERRA